MKKLPLKGTAYYWSSGKGICKVSKKQKLLIMESGAMGSSSWSNCFYVKAGRAIKVDKAGEGLIQLKGKDFAIHMTAFDMYTGELNSGHTYKRYYLKWTGTKFVEYTGTRITQKELKKYKGASAILKKAKKEGFSIGTIYKRKNGIINVNLFHSYSSGGQDNENLTLKVSGKKVSLVKAGSARHYDDTSWIGKYSYSGIYEASGFTF